LSNIEISEIPKQNKYPIKTPISLSIIFTEILGKKEYKKHKFPTIFFTNATF